MRICSFCYYYFNLCSLFIRCSALFQLKAYTLLSRDPIGYADCPSGFDFAQDDTDEKARGKAERNLGGTMLIAVLCIHRLKAYAPSRLPPRGAPVAGGWGSVRNNEICTNLKPTQRKIFFVKLLTKIGFCGIISPCNQQKHQEMILWKKLWRYSRFAAHCLH